MNGISEQKIMIFLSGFLFLQLFTNTSNIIYSHYKYTGRRRIYLEVYNISNFIALVILLIISTHGAAAFQHGIVNIKDTDIRYNLIFTIFSRILLIKYLISQRPVCKLRIVVNIFKMIFFVLLLPTFDSVLTFNISKGIFYLVSLILIDENLSLSVRSYFSIRNNISFASLIEASENVNMGAVFVNAKDKIVIINSYAEKFLDRTTTKRVHTLDEFHSELRRDDKDFEFEETCNHTRSGIIRFEDGSSYKIIEREICVKKKKYIELDIYEITNFDKVMRELRKKNNELESLNTELVKIINGIDQITMERESINLRHKVHDIIGQRLSIIVASVQELEMLGKSSASEEQLYRLLDSMLYDLRNEHLGEVEDRLDNLVESFRVMGVELIISGDKIIEEDIRNHIISIFRETTTNAIRHGNANKVFMNIIDEDTSYLISIWNNGNTKIKDVIEGTGLKGIRRQVETIDGEIEFLMDEFFTIRIKVRRPQE